jgi:hypothetical protein
MPRVTSYGWDQMVTREARGEDDIGLGEIKQIGLKWVMTEKLDEKEMARFYLPKVLAKGFDGEFARFNITEEQAEKDFMRPLPPALDEYDVYRTQTTPASLDSSIPSMRET